MMRDDAELLQVLEANVRERKWNRDTAKPAETCSLRQAETCVGQHYLAVAIGVAAMRRAASRKRIRAPRSSRFLVSFGSCEFRTEAGAVCVRTMKRPTCCVSRSVGTNADGEKRLRQARSVLSFRF